jgi:hypothetical protein
MPGLALSAFPLAFRLINFSQKQAFGGESAWNIEQAAVTDALEILIRERRQKAWLLVSGIASIFTLWCEIVEILIARHRNRLPCPDQLFSYQWEEELVHPLVSKEIHTF